MKNLLSIVLACCTTVLFGLYIAEVKKNAPQPQIKVEATHPAPIPEVGRYVVTAVPGSDAAMMIDSITGRAWRVEKQNMGKLVLEPITYRQIAGFEAHIPEDTAEVKTRRYAAFKLWEKEFVESVKSTK
jgi:hypothetical protein